MTNPTHQQITNAHEALRELCRLADNPPLFVFKDPHKISELRQTILAALPLQPTMAEVEWEDDKHYLAEAEHPAYGKVIMIEPYESNLVDVYEDSVIKVLIPTQCKHKAEWAHRNDLTPTGKRYTLMET